MWKSFGSLKYGAGVACAGRASGSVKYGAKGLSLGLLARSNTAAGWVSRGYGLGEIRSFGSESGSSGSVKYGGWMGESGVRARSNTEPWA